MPGPAPRVAALLWALLFPLIPAVAAVVTGLWLRSRYRRGDPADTRRAGSGDT